MEKFYAMDFKNNKKSEYFNTMEEAVKAANEFNKQGGWALPMHMASDGMVNDIKIK